MTFRQNQPIHPVARVGDKRWTAARKREIRDSRPRGTATIARACAESTAPPRVLVSASATGCYGDTGERLVDESEPAGNDSSARHSARCSERPVEDCVPRDRARDPPASGKVVRGAAGRVRARPARGIMVAQPQRCRDSAEDR
ncbi:hypothetical protein [Streptomyces sp. FXJ1.172]|uniref:hypothetical protein n=1 Tax=Streptomyces sp. FXJ1.172 TaxID=710705 RepID=UPI000A655B62